RWPSRGEDRLSISRKGASSSTTRILSGVASPTSAEEASSRVLMRRKVAADGGTGSAGASGLQPAVKRTAASALPVPRTRRENRVADGAPPANGRTLKRR